jgi:hypothetical protein
VTTSPVCPWCGRPFRARRGGSAQRFCCARCRISFWSALRRWGERAVAAGILTGTDIRSGDPEACTLLLGASSPATTPELGSEVEALGALLSRARRETRDPKMDR